MADDDCRLSPVSTNGKPDHIVWVLGLATAVCGFASNFAHPLVARVGVGIGEAGGSPPTVSVIADYFPRQRRASAMAIYGLAVATGAFLGGSAGGYIALHWGWRAAFLIVGFPGVVVALLQWLTLGEPRRGRNDPGIGVSNTPPFSAVLRRFRDRPSLHHTKHDGAAHARVSSGRDRPHLHTGGSGAGPPAGRRVERSLYAAHSRVISTTSAMTPASLRWRVGKPRQPACKPR